MIPETLLPVSVNKSNKIFLGLHYCDLHFHRALLYVMGRLTLVMKKKLQWFNAFVRDYSFEFKLHKYFWMRTGTTVRVFSMKATSWGLPTYFCDVGKKLWAEVNSFLVKLLKLMAVNQMLFNIFPLVTQMAHSRACVLCQWWPLHNLCASSNVLGLSLLKASSESYKNNLWIFYLVILQKFKWKGTPAEAQGYLRRD